MKGAVFGKFTVVGFHERRPKKSGVKSAARNMWVARCVCGLFEIRSEKAIKNPKNQGDSCHRCRNVDFLKQNLNNREGGKYLDWE